MSLTFVGECLFCEIIYVSKVKNSATVLIVLPLEQLKEIVCVELPFLFVPWGQCKITYVHLVVLSLKIT